MWKGHQFGRHDDIPLRMKSICMQSWMLKTDFLQEVTDVGRRSCTTTIKLTLTLPT